MGRYIQKATLTTAIAFLGLVAIDIPSASGTNLSIGKYAYLKHQLKTVSFARQEKKLTHLVEGNEVLISASQNSEIDKNILLNKIIQPNNILKNDSQLDVSLQQSIDRLKTADKLEKDIAKYAPTFIENKSLQIPDADKINQDIQDRYLGLIKEDTEQISLFEANKILSSTDNAIGAEFNAGEESELASEDLKQLQETINVLNSPGSILDLLNEERKAIAESKPLMGAIIAILASSFTFIAAPFVSVFTTAMNEGIISDLQEKYGKPEVPEGSVFMHNRYLKELTTIATKAQRLESEKFGNDEFLLYVQIKKNVAKGNKDFKKLNNSVELLRAAIAGQKSFMRLEQIELRFRGRKQQEFYKFVADNIDDKVDKHEFKNKVKKKLAEVIPLLNTDEGRDALQGYLKEIDYISQYELGLKLLALFKKYDLSDYAILRTVSDVVDRVQGHELLSPKSLVSLVIENYDTFEKLGPIIGVSEEEGSPQAYAKILQYIGLINRHADAYRKFEQLVKSLRGWQKPHDLMMAVRREYPAREYRLPDEFKTEIPGINIHKKYAKHL